MADRIDDRTRNELAVWVEHYLAAGAVDIAWAFARRLESRPGAHERRPVLERCRLALLVAEVALRRWTCAEVTPAGLPPAPGPDALQYEDLLARVDALRALAALRPVPDSMAARMDLARIEVDLLRGQYPEAHKRVGAWLRRFAIGQEAGVVVRLHLAGARAAQALGRGVEREEHIQRALAQAPRCRQRLLHAECCLVAGRWLCDRGRFDEGGRFLREASDLFTAMGRRREGMCARLWMAWALEHRGGLEPALREYRRVHQDASGWALADLAGLGRVRMGLLLLRQGRERAARWYFLTALRGSSAAQALAPLAGLRRLGCAPAALLAYEGLLRIHAAAGAPGARLDRLRTKVDRLAGMIEPAGLLGEEIRALRAQAAGRRAPRSSAGSPPDPTRAAQPAPAVGPAPAVEPASAVEPAPPVESAPAVEPAPPVEPAPAVESSRVMEPAPPVESALPVPGEAWERLGIVTRSPRFLRELHLARQVAGSDLPVVLLGETGCGKELLARAIHAISGCGGPLVAYNAARSHGDLAEADLFGHRRGAFTGALQDRPGLVRRADGGTLFLDEVAELSARTQAALLRFLDRGSIRPVGCERETGVRTRIIVATHQELPRLAREGRFRADLYFRMAGAEVRIPPLRKRSEDIVLLARRFAARAGLPSDQSRMWIDERFAERLVTYPWPGNVRQLLHWARLLAHLVQSGPDHEHIGPVMERLLCSGLACHPGSGMMPGARGLAAPRRPSRAHLVTLLRTHQGNITQLARELRIHRTQLYRWLRCWGLEPDEYRPGVASGAGQDLEEPLADWHLEVGQ